MTARHNLANDANILRASPMVHRAVCDVVRVLISEHEAKLGQAKDILVFNDSARPSALKETGALAALRELLDIIGATA